MLAGLEPDGTLNGFLTNIADPLWQQRASYSEMVRIGVLLERELDEGALGIGILVGYAPHIGPDEYLSVSRLAAERACPRTHTSATFWSFPAQQLSTAPKNSFAERGARGRKCISATSTPHAVDTSTGFSICFGELVWRAHS